MGADYTVAHASVLAAQLPPESRCVIKGAAKTVWSESRYVLERLDYHLEHLIWMLSEDGHKKINQPKPHETPQDLDRLEAQLQETERTRSELDAYFPFVSKR